MSDSDSNNPCADCEAEQDRVRELLRQAIADKEAAAAQINAIASDGMVMDTTDMTPNVRFVCLGCTTEDQARAAILNSAYAPAAVVRAGTAFGVGGGVMRLDLD